MSQEALLGLWRTYKETGDVAARDRLVFSLAPVVKAIVYRKIREIPAYREVDDYISCGLEALIKSLDRYDPEKGATLEQYAWTRIHGAVLDELRRQDWAPRSLRRWERDIAKARERFAVNHGRQPSTEELAESMGTSTEMASASASSSRVGRRPWIVLNWSRALAMSRSQRRSERGAQSWRRSSSSTAPWIRVHAYCSSVAPLDGS